jgi:hypothetical protein
MTGITAKYGTWIDQIGVVCRKVNENGTLGDEFTRGPVGGQGGWTSMIRRCDPGRVIGGAFGRTGWYIDEIRARCYTWDRGTRRLDEKDTVKSFSIGKSRSLGGSFNLFACGSKPAKGLRGKHGRYVDSLQIFCNDWDQ